MVILDKHANIHFVWEFKVGNRSSFFVSRAAFISKLKRLKTIVISDYVTVHYSKLLACRVDRHTSAH